MTVGSEIHDKEHCHRHRLYDKMGANLAVCGPPSDIEDNTNFCVRFVPALLGEECGSQEACLARGTKHFFCRFPTYQEKAMLQAPKVELPGDDARWRIVQGMMRRNGFSRHALIETLHTVQESFGYLDHESLRFVAESLRVPYSRVYSVSTFYHMFSLKPAGEHTCVMCTGTACYIKGINKMLEDIEQTYEIKPGATTQDGKISLLTARCLGSCGLAPVAVFDGEVVGKLNADDVGERLAKWSNGHV
jgi:bidirectional [NiFe] hydrogenase diaphorase subunit